METVKTVSMWVIIGIGVIGVLLSLIVKKIVGKVLSLIIAAGLVYFAWQQRESVITYAEEVRGKACDSATGALTNATTDAATKFLGITVSLPPGWCTPAS